MIPRPRQWRKTAQGTALGDGLVIAAAHGSGAAPVADLLAAELAAATGWSVRRSGDLPEVGPTPSEAYPGGVIVLRLTETETETETETGAGAGAGDRQAIRPGPSPGDPGRAAPSGQAEGYRLCVGPGGVEIVAPAPAGLFYGTRTLRQLLPPELLRAAPVRPPGLVPVEGCQVDDSPRFAWRGLALDVSRHFFPKSFLLRLLDLVALHKFNVLHLHLTDDQGWRVELAGYPRLTQVGAWRRESPAGHYNEGRRDGTPHGGYYTQADLAEVVSYAARRFVTVVPEIDMPGHMQAAIAAYPELGNTGEKLEVLTNWGISEHVLNMEESTVQFCTRVLQEVMSIFPSPYVHIGGDECPTSEWGSSARAQERRAELGLGGTSQLQAWFTARVAEVLRAGGRSMVAWDEVLDAGAPPGTVIMFWRYDHAPDAPARAARQGLDVVMAPEPWSYFDWAYSHSPREPLAIRAEVSVEKAYSSEPVPPGLEPELAHHIFGVEGELWTEYVTSPQQAEYMYFPRACALAEVAWSSHQRQWPEFEHRLGEHLARLDALGVNYRPLDGPNPGQARTWEEPR